MRTDFLIYRHPDDVQIAFQGAAFTLFLIIISTVSFKVYQRVVPLGWLSLVGVFLWPRWSHAYMTPILIAVLGLISDLLLGRFLGLSSLIFLTFFWLVKPTQREKSLSLLKSWLEFSLVSTVILSASFFIIGRVVDVTVGWSSLIGQILMILAVFPIIFALRTGLRRWLIDPNDVNYQ